MSAAMGTSAAPMLRRLPFSVAFMPSSLERINSFTSADTGFAIHGILIGSIEAAGVTVRLAQPLAVIPGDASRVTPEMAVAALEVCLSLARADAGNTGLKPVGWYAIRKSGGLLARDVALHSRYFEQTGEIALVIVPGQHSTRLEIYSRAAQGEFSQNAHRWGVLQLRAGQQFAAPLDVVMRPQGKDNLSLQSYRNSAESSWPLRRIASRARHGLQVALIFLVALVISYLVASHFSHGESSTSGLLKRSADVTAASGRSSEAEPLQLQVAYEGKQVAIHWNPANPAINRASEGTLEIHDGGSDHHVHLDRVQLETGSMLYTPRADRVALRLSIRTQGGSEVAEVLRFSAHESKPAQLQSVAQASLPKLPVPATADSGERSAGSEQPTRSAQAPPAVSERVQRLPRISRLARPAVQPPQPLHEVTPNVSGIVPAVLSSPKQVTVTVWIDTSGRVYRAAASNVNVSNAALVPASLAAARQWTFAPASIGGRVVPGQHTIIFRFQSRSQ